MEKDNTPSTPFGRALSLLCDISGWACGLILGAIATTTVVSVIGRAAFASPIEGDVEMVQFGVAICIAACLPYAQFQRANIIVDFFTAGASARTQSRMDALGTLLYSLVLVLVAWRVSAGGLAAWRNGEVSMLLSWPVWVSYAAMVPSLVLACVVGLYQLAGLWAAPAGGEGAA